MHPDDGVLVALRGLEVRVAEATERMRAGDPDPTNAFRGLYLTDDLENPTKHKIEQSMVLPAGQMNIFFADDDPEEGVNHLPFKLDADGDVIAIFDTDERGRYLIDMLEIVDQPDDSSLLRCPDGSWVNANPSPGDHNAGCGGLYMPLVVNNRLLR